MTQSSVTNIVGQLLFSLLCSVLTRFLFTYVAVVDHHLICRVGKMAYVPPPYAIHKRLQDQCYIYSSH